MGIFQEGIIDNIKNAFMKSLNYAILSEPEYRRTMREPATIFDSIAKALMATVELSIASEITSETDDKNKTTITMSKERWNYLKDTKLIIFVSNPKFQNNSSITPAVQGPAISSQAPDNQYKAEKRYVSTFKELVDECGIKIAYTELDDKAKERIESFKPICEAYKKLTTDKELKNFLTFKLAPEYDEFIFGYAPSLRIGKFDLSSVYNDETEYQSTYAKIEEAINTTSSSLKLPYMLKIEEVEDWNGSIVITEGPRPDVTVTQDPVDGEEEIEVRTEPEDSTDTDGASNAPEPGEAPQNTTEKVLDNAKNENAAVAAAVVGMNTPFITVHTYLTSPTYTVSNDIATKRSMVVDKGTKKLKLIDNKDATDKVKVFKYVGKNKDGLEKLKKNLGKEVNQNFIYETISGRSTVFENQIFWDEDFEEIDLDKIQHETENDRSTIIGKLFMATHDGLPKGKEVTTNEAARLIGDNLDIAIYENARGYYAINKKTLRHTPTVENIKDICITEDLNNVKF